MALNFHTGYGRMIANAIASRRPNMGRVFFVATTGVTGWDEFSELFPTGPEGNTRVWTTLKGLLDADVIEDGGDDVVFVLPNHTESINSAGAIDTGTDSAGLTVIGLGEADERPLFTFGAATTADINIGSNGVTFDNLRFDLTGVDALAAPLDVNSTGFTLRNCEVITADADGQATLALLTDASAGSMTIDGCYFRGSQTAGTTTALRIVGGSNSVIKNNVFIGNYKSGAGAIEVTTTAAGNLLIENNKIFNNTASSVSAMTFTGGTTAIIVGNVLGIRSGTTPIYTNLGGGAGYLVIGRNYYKAASTAAAGTLL